MKQFLAVASLAIFTLLVMDLGQVVTAPGGLAITGGKAMAADLYTKGKAPVVTSRY
jgi:hypothetical protein